ncbi:hypothetical protein B566_EDAN016523 [Ephemera danica]|nr:hypothetical protein B566_EDAN016523 [Ephemera danica]
MLKAQKRNISQMVITEGMFHKPDTLQVLDFIPFKLQKQSHFNVPRAKPDSEEVAVSFATNFLDVYFENIAANASANAITIPITITLMEQDMTAIQAAVIFFTPNFAFGRLETLMIGNLTQKIMLSSNKEMAAVLKYFPEKPYPVNISARSEFAMDGACFCSPLETIAIDFINLFQPLPIPEEFFNSSRHYRRKIFSQLWDDLNREGATNNCISATVVTRPLSQIHLKMKNELKPFVIQKGAHEADIGIYLAPTNHVLLKAAISEDSSIFSIATDDIYLLAHINDFLSHW